MLKLRAYQEKAVKKMVEETFHLLSMGHRKVLVLNSPTGSGKTIMSAEWLKQTMEQLPDSNLIHKEYAFIWIAPQKLHTQSLLKLKSYFEEYKTLRCLEFNDISDGALSNGDLLFLNWASINNENNIYIRDNEEGNNLPTFLNETRVRGIELVVIIDEAHFGAGQGAEQARKFLSMVNASLEVEVSATPDRQGDEMIRVHREDVIREEMIKKGIQLNADLVPTGDLSLNQFLLNEALKRQKKLLKLYKETGSPVRPLLLIQLPSDTQKESVNDKSVREEIEIYLRLKNITIDNGKLAVWLSDFKTPNLNTVENNDSIVEVLIFKQAVALGWDCPRASVLAIYREIKTTSFGIQTVGRILRMPEQKHYTSDLLNYGYVYTNLESRYIEFVNEESEYFNQIIAYRRDFVKDLHLLSSDILIWILTTNKIPC